MGGFPMFSPWMQLGNNPWTDIYRRTQAGIGGPAQQPQPPAPISPLQQLMPTRGRAGQAPTQAPMPGMQPLQQPPLQMQNLRAAAPAQMPQQTWQSALASIDPATWFAMAGAFLNAEGDPGQAFTGVSQALQGQEQRRFQEEDQDYLQEARGRERRNDRQAQEDRTRARESYTRALNDPTLSPEMRNAMIALGPDGYAQVMASQVQTADARAQASQFDRQLAFQGEQSALDRQAQLESARISAYGRANADRPSGASSGWSRPTGRDSILMSDYESATGAARDLLNSGIPRLRALFGQMVQYDAQGRAIPASMRMTMNRFLERHPEQRAAFEQIESAIWPLVQEKLKGLAPITQFELSQAISRTPSGDWTPEAVFAELDNMERAARQTVELGTRAFDFTQEGGSLLNGRNAAGQNWDQVRSGVYEQYGYGGGEGGQQRDPRAARPPVRISDNFRERVSIPNAIRAQLEPAQWSSPNAVVNVDGWRFQRRGDQWILMGVDTSGMRLPFGAGTMGDLNGGQFITDPRRINQLTQGWR